MSRKLLIPGLIIFGVLLLLLSSPSSNNESTNENITNDQELLATEAPKTDEKKQASFSLEEVADHATKNDCWTVIDGIVYDITEFIATHPGGDRIMKICGLDGTEDFKNQGVPQEEADNFRQEVDLPADAEFHSPDARNILSSYEIGILENKAE